MTPSQQAHDLEAPSAFFKRDIAEQHPVTPQEPFSLFNELEDLEHEIHIEDAHWQYRIAYERFQLYGCPHDRDEALLHLHRMNTAILARSPAVQYQRHADFERRLEERYAYFNSDAAVALARGLAG